MTDKILLYVHTIRRMKPIQIVSRVKKLLGIPCSLGVQPSMMHEKLRRFDSVEELDHDAVFLQRFPPDEFVAGTATFLHESEQIDWHGIWEFPNRSALWNFNLHYFEFLMPMVDAYQRTGDSKYLQTIEDAISGWIKQNPCRSGGTGWASYPIAIRLTYWFSCYFALEDVLSQPLKKRMVSSIYEQYVYLSSHLEKDLLANHYFEDLKALILSAIAFQDDKMLECALKEFKVQCRAQILPDGMHYELSPMYHKIILEDVMRVAVALRSIGRQDNEIEQYLPKMLDVAYSFEDGLARIPLFNDGGNNVAKSLEALLAAGKNHFGLTPHLVNQLTDSGYYFFQHGNWRLIVDAGAPGAKENPGHAHCDAMSFELFHNGEPVLVNCGTFAYQCDDRAFFRSTAAHNTVMIDGTEQSECWDAFRMGRGSQTRVLKVDENGIEMEMTDQHGQKVQREICFDGRQLLVRDCAPEHMLKATIHVIGLPNEAITSSSQAASCTHWYAIDYVQREAIRTLLWSARDEVAVCIKLVQ